MDFAQGKEIERLSSVYIKLLRNAGVTLFGAAPARRLQPCTLRPCTRSARLTLLCRCALRQRGAAVWLTRTRSRWSWQRAARRPSPASTSCWRWAASRPKLPYPAACACRAVLGACCALSSFHPYCVQAITLADSLHNKGQPDCRSMRSPRTRR